MKMKTKIFLVISALMFFTGLQITAAKNAYRRGYMDGMLRGTIYLFDHKKGASIAFREVAAEHPKWSDETIEQEARRRNPWPPKGYAGGTNWVPLRKL